MPSLLNDQTVGALVDAAKLDGIQLGIDSVVLTLDARAKEARKKLEASTDKGERLGFEIAADILEGLAEAFLQSPVPGRVMLDPDDPNARPLWMGDAANVIVEQWDQWSAAAEHTALVEQNADSYAYAMIGSIERALSDAYCKGSV